jgi:hypothetical protein
MIIITFQPIVILAIIIIISFVITHILTIITLRYIASIIDISENPLKPEDDFGILSFHHIFNHFSTSIILVR